MGKRRRSREIALQCLYQWDFHGPGSEESAEIFWESRHDPQPVKEFAQKIVEGVKREKDYIDSLIESASEHWKLYRMSRIDRNVLRIAVYEIEFIEDIPPKVSIDEAIEMGKRFGSTESASFINGILDRVWKKKQERNGPKPSGEKTLEHSSDRDTG